MEKAKLAILLLFVIGFSLWRPSSKELVEQSSASWGIRLRKAILPRMQWSNYRANAVRLLIFADSVSRGQSARRGAARAVDYSCQNGACPVYGLVFHGYYRVSILDGSTVELRKLYNVFNLAPYILNTVAHLTNRARPKKIHPPPFFKGGN
jgi:hypothetical protein